MRKEPPGVVWNHWGWSPVTVSQRKAEHLNGLFWKVLRIDDRIFFPSWKEARINNFSLVLKWWGGCHGVVKVLATPKSSDRAPRSGEKLKRQPTSLPHPPGVYHGNQLMGQALGPGQFIVVPSR